MLRRVSKATIDDVCNLPMCVVSGPAPRLSRERTQNSDVGALLDHSVMTKQRFKSKRNSTNFQLPPMFLGDDGGILRDLALALALKRLVVSASRAVFVIVSGSDGLTGRRTKTLLQSAK